MKGLSFWVFGVFLLSSVKGSNNFSFNETGSNSADESANLEEESLDIIVASHTFIFDGVFGEDGFFEESPSVQITRIGDPVEALSLPISTNDMLAVSEEIIGEPLAIVAGNVVPLTSDVEDALSVIRHAVLDSRMQPNAHSFVPYLNEIENVLRQLSHEPVTIHKLLFFFFTVFDAFGPFDDGKIDAFWQYILKHPEFLALEVDEKHTFLMKLLISERKTSKTLELLEDLLEACHSLESFSHQQQLEIYALIAGQCREAEDYDLVYFVRLIAVVMKYYEEPIMEEGIYHYKYIHSYFDLGTDGPGDLLTNRALLLHFAPIFKPLFRPLACDITETIEIWRKIAIEEDGKEVYLYTNEHLIIFNSILKAAFYCKPCSPAGENLRFVIFQIQKILISDHQNHLMVHDMIRKCWSLDLPVLLDAILFSLTEYHGAPIVPLAESMDLLLTSVSWAGIYLSYHEEYLPTNQAIELDTQVLIEAAALVSHRFGSQNSGFTNNWFHLTPEWQLGSFSRLTKIQRQGVLLQLAKIYLVRQGGIPYSSATLEGIESKSILEISEFVNEKIHQLTGRLFRI